MAKVRLDDEDEQLLDRLALKFGGRAAAVREALQRLAAEEDRKEAFDDFMAEWARESGPPDPEAVEAMAQHYAS